MFYKKIKFLLRVLLTVRHLKFMQLLFFIIRRKAPSFNVSSNIEPIVDSSLKLASPVAVHNIYSEEGGFLFLNYNLDFCGPIDWRTKSVSRLWLYNLHYFDYLRCAQINEKNKSVWLESWIFNNPQGSHPGWEPFTASLRIVNWILYFIEKPEVLTVDIKKSLYLQVLWLEKNDERHILANHYFENLKALAFAGVMFSGSDAERWLVKGVNGLSEQLVEQSLADGGHYERTPQYHALMLENYLDIYNLAINNLSLFPEKFTRLVASHCEQALQFYHGILFPDGLLPLFNDTAFGIAPSYNELEAYWLRLGGRTIQREVGELIDYQASGLFGYRHGMDMVIIDAGEIGPSYQPGHTHCDMLSFELMFNGQRIIVDSGVFEYEPGPMRHYVRSTRAHNTVSIDGFDQSEVWGEFRVARRAKILSGSICGGDDEVSFSGSYTGFHQAGTGLVHRRDVVMKKADDQTIESMAVVDVVEGRGEYLLESFIHFHPALECLDKQGRIQLVLDDKPIAEVIIGNSTNYHFEEGYYCPEFGIKLSNARLVLTETACLPCQLSYTIRKI